MILHVKCVESEISFPFTENVHNTLLVIVLKISQEKANFVPQIIIAQIIVIYATSDKN